MMWMIFKTGREWTLAILCLIMLSTQFFPQAIELFYPILDWKGGNRLNMQVDRDMSMGSFYHCGEVVFCRFIVQKQRNAVGTLQWKLVSAQPGGFTYNYQPRQISAPIGITDHQVMVEALPDMCLPGQYHFTGTMVYPQLFGNVIYTIQTTCFVVKGKKK